MEKVIPIYTRQNIDRPITSKAYQTPELEGKLLVTSVFRTHQGEGRYSGYPAIFLRLAGCNYGAKDSHCKWCDTSFQFDSGMPMGYAEILVKAEQLVGGDDSVFSRYVLVITGGEPTLQHNLIDFLKYVGSTNDFQAFEQVMIETNGTQNHFFDAVMTKLNEYESPFICVSPKASYKAGRYAELPQRVLNMANELKFVLDADPDSVHHTIPDWALEYSKGGGQVLVSPMAHYARAYVGEVSSIWEPGLIDHARTSANYAYAGRYAIEHNLRISTQQHLFLGVA